MIILLKKDAAKEQIDSLSEWLTGQGFRLHFLEGEKNTILGLAGDTSTVDVERLRALDIVEDVKRIQEPYKNVNRKFHPEDTVIGVAGRKVGGGNFMVIAGPCSVETEEQIVGVAQAVKASGADLLRGGAFKPRTSPYSFQGLREEGLRLLSIAKKETGLPLVSEVMDISQLTFFDDIDVIQVGARNMQNYELLKELGHVDKPILLKRGPMATFEELLMSAEYIMAGGNGRVILCERGIRGFETYTRSVLDLSAVPVLHRLSHLPVVVDPSHATGRSELVPSMALAATAAGADGLIIEVHNDPPHALCDGRQSLTPAAFDALMKKVRQVRDLCAGFRD